MNNSPTLPTANRHLANAVAAAARPGRWSPPGHAAAKRKAAPAKKATRRPPTVPVPSVVARRPAAVAGPFRVAAKVIAASPETAVTLLEREFGLQPAAYRVKIAMANHVAHRLRHVFAASPALRDEFGAVAAFAAFARGSAEGRVRVARSGAIAV